MPTKELLRTQKDRWNGTAGCWAQGFRSGSIVLLQGQTGLTLDGDTVFPYDPAGQRPGPWSTSGSSCACRRRPLGRREDRRLRDGSRAPGEEVYPVIDEYFGELKPCSTGLIVSGLALPELVVEIDAYGLIDG